MAETTHRLTIKMLYHILDIQTLTCRHTGSDTYPRKQKHCPNFTAFSHVSVKESTHCKCMFSVVCYKLTLNEHI